MSRAWAVAGVLRNDARRIARDSFLVSSLVYILGSSAALRWVLPWIGRVVRTRWAVDLAPYYPLIVSYFAAVMSSLAVGLVGGFLLLESREDRTLWALAVSPLRLERYLITISSLTTLAAVGIVVAESWLIGLGLPPWPALLPVAAVGGLFAPIVAFSLAALASNKLEAFALMKLLGLVGAVPLAAYFLPPPWEYLGVIAPPYWALKAWWVAEAGGSGWMLWLVGGAAVSAALVAVLARQLSRAGTGPME
jgi:fluoroquinolone transport system permease protein